MLEPLFHSKTLIYADNMDMAGTKFYAEYVLGKSDVYKSEILHRGKGMLTRLS